MATSSNLPSRYIAWLTINRGCQLRCDWCYAKDSGFNSRMSDDTFSKSLKLFREVGVREVCLIGGEPTIDRRFLSMVHQLNSHGFFVSVVTNGVRFADESFLDEAVQAGLRNIVVSMKATDRDGYIKNTHRDVFDDVMKAASNLSRIPTDARVRHNLSVTLCGEMNNDLKKVVNAIVQSGIKKVTFDTERPIVNAGQIEFTGLRPAAIAKFLAQSYDVIDSLRDFGVEYTVYVTHPHCIFPDEYITKLERAGRLVSGCQIQRGNGIVVDERGEILPCNHFCKSSFGSLDRCTTAKDFTDWRTSESVVRFYKKVTDYPTKLCSECPRWEKCGAGCRIHWMKFGEDEMLCMKK